MDIENIDFDNIDYKNLSEDELIAIFSRLRENSKRRIKASEDRLAQYRLENKPK